ncbi:Zinc/iron permease [Hesseltinella vesiculosa]|uniref:Zinc/iron permease n=1 Tax=Hesseltinella vesiculosa TaxID=101127 RepID=A0A1X2GWE6_9FUNG|nr:Zinc/iron permease [Hesseltinella vesiculosa]
MKQVLTALLLFLAISMIHAQNEADTHADDGVADHSHHPHVAGYDEETCLLEVNQHYNMNLRIGAIFITAGTSAFGVLLPVFLHRIQPNYSDRSIRHWILMLGKFFGSGVILATAFIHMLPEAMERFHSPCLSEGWHEYHGFGGVFCMLAAFVLQWIELIAVSRIHKQRQQEAEASQAQNDKFAYDDGSEVALPSKFSDPETGCHQHLYATQTNHHSIALARISTVLLELGIALHSIIIGFTLGTSTEDTFVILLIAMVFHQFFEGLALGTRINELGYETWFKPFLMTAVYSATTPIGLVIGICVRLTMDPPSSILAQAILDAISAGILLYNAYISLMSTEMNHNVAFHELSWTRKIMCLLTMYVGAAIMSIIGIWA